MVWIVNVMLITSVKKCSATSRFPWKKWTTNWILKQMPMCLPRTFSKMNAIRTLLLLRYQCSGPWTWWWKPARDACLRMRIPTISTPSQSTVIVRHTCLQTTCASTCGTWRSPTAASVSFGPLVDVFFFCTHHDPLRGPGLTTQQVCSLTLTFKTSLTSNRPTWRSWRRWSQQRSSILSSATPSSTAAAKEPSVCATWGRRRCATGTPSVSALLWSPSWPPSLDGWPKHWIHGAKPPDQH